MIMLIILVFFSFYYGGNNILSSSLCSRWKWHYFYSLIYLIWADGRKSMQIFLRSSYKCETQSMKIQVSSVDMITKPYRIDDILGEE